MCLSCDFSLPSWKDFLRAASHTEDGFSITARAILLSLALIFCAVALGVLPLAIAFDLVRGAAARRATKRALERSGLVATVQWLTAVTLEGVRDGVAIRVEFDVSRPLPGRPTSPDGDDPRGTRIVLDSSGRDTFVCARRLTDAILGPLPPSPRQPTGDPRFDAAFDVFGALPPPNVRDPLGALGLQWLRQKDGQLELFLGELGANQVASAVEVALACAQQPDPASYRDAAPGVAIVVPASERARFEVQNVSTPLVLAALASLLVGLLGGLLLPLVPGVSESFSDFVCEPGFHAIPIRGTFEDGATYHDVVCVAAGVQKPPSSLLGLGCAALACAAPLGLGLLLTLARVVSALRRPHPRDA